MRVAAGSGNPTSADRPPLQTSEGTYVTEHRKAFAPQISRHWSAPRPPILGIGKGEWAVLGKYGRAEPVGHGALTRPERASHLSTFGTGNIYSDDPRDGYFPPLVSRIPDITNRDRG